MLFGHLFGEKRKTEALVSYAWGRRPPVVGVLLIEYGSVKAILIISSQDNICSSS